MEDSLIPRDRGTPRKTIGKTIKRELNFNGLNVNTIYDRTLLSFDPYSRPYLYYCWLPPFNL